MRYVLVGLFGALGSLLRFALAVGLAGVSAWPLATFLVNVLGSFALGFVSEALVTVRLFGVDAQLVLGTGFLGGFTTYSAFDVQALRMLERGEWARGGGYIVATVLVCLLAGYAGLALGRALR